jgi:enoyl-CoA hydratase/carnithine racemase
MSGMAKDQGAVRYRAENGIAHLTFDRPAARNAMTWSMYEELADGLRRIEADETVRVAVLRGAGGKAFVAGTDIEQFTTFTSGEDGVAYEHRIDGFVDALARLRVPTVAAVEGWAVGGGLAIANACDIRIATKGARFGVPIARTLGNCLSPANLRRLSATLGVAMVKRMLLLAEMPTAELLEPLGYLAAVVEPEALDETVAAICETLRGHAPVTMRVTRALLLQLETDSKPDGTELIRECYGSNDFAAGVRAFLAKDKPSWIGR